MAALSTTVIGFMYQAGERSLAAAQHRFTSHVDRMLADLARAPLSRPTLQEPYADAWGFCLI